MLFTLDDELIFSILPHLHEKRTLLNRRVNKPCALLGLLALMPFAFIAEQSFLTALICVYLWAFSLAILLWQGVKFIKGKLCKNPLKA